VLLIDFLGTEDAENAEKEIIFENLAKSTGQSMKNFVAIQLKP
jgi:hypothetical protein